MLDSSEEVLCFYVQDIVYASRNLREKLNLAYKTRLSKNRNRSVENIKKIKEDILKEFNNEIMDVSKFVMSVPSVYVSRELIVTGATNDQVYIENWAFLKESFEEYMNKISNLLIFYFKNIGNFYTSFGELDEEVIVNINSKLCKLDSINTYFTLAVNYLFDVSPLVFYDKFRLSLKRK